MVGLTVAVRFLLYLNLMVLFGLLAFSLYALRGPERVSGAVLPLTIWTAAASLAGIAFSLLGMGSLVADLSGTALLSPDRETLHALMFETSNGVAWRVRIAALVVALIASFVIGRWRLATGGAVAGALAAGCALATLAWGGHGAAGEGTYGWLQLVADIAHLLSAGAWVGALVAMLLLVVPQARAVEEEDLRVSHRVLAGFSVMGTLVVGVLVVTGLVNLLGTVGFGGIPGVARSLYGELLLAKVGLFGAMLAVAAGNRFRHVPAFERAIAKGDPEAALISLRRSLVVESSCAVAILALVAWLGTLDPVG